MIDFSLCYISFKGKIVDNGLNSLKFKERGFSEVEYVLHVPGRKEATTKLMESVSALFSEEVHHPCIRIPKRAIEIWFESG